MINILFFYTHIYMIYSKFDASGIVDTECKIHTRYIHVHAKLEEIIDKIILYTDVFLCIKLHKFHLGLHVQYAIHNLLLPDSINLNIRNRSSIRTILQINNYIFLSNPLLFQLIHILSCYCLLFIWTTQNQYNAVLKPQISVYKWTQFLQNKTLIS